MPVSYGGKFYGKDEHGEFYNGIVVFMVVGLRKSIPHVIKTLPETKISAVITDNHSVNVAAFSFLKKEFSPNNSDEDLFLFHPSGK